MDKSRGFVVHRTSSSQPSFDGADSAPSCLTNTSSESTDTTQSSLQVCSRRLDEEPSVSRFLLPASAAKPTGLIEDPTAGDAETSPGLYELPDCLEEAQKMRVEEQPDDGSACEPSAVDAASTSDVLLLRQYEISDTLANMVLNLCRIFDQQQRAATNENEVTPSVEDDDAKKREMSSSESTFDQQQRAATGENEGVPSDEYDDAKKPVMPSTESTSDDEDATKDPGESSDAEWRSHGQMVACQAAVKSMMRRQLVYSQTLKSVISVVCKKWKESERQNTELRSKAKNLENLLEDLLEERQVALAFKDDMPESPPEGTDEQQASKNLVGSDLQEPPDRQDRSRQNHRRLQCPIMSRGDSNGEFCPRPSKGSCDQICAKGHRRTASRGGMIERMTSAIVCIGSKVAFTNVKRMGRRIGEHGLHLLRPSSVKMIRNLVDEKPPVEEIRFQNTPVDITKIDDLDDIDMPAEGEQVLLLI